MIQRLLIRNYAIIEKLEIDFSDRLTIITGETGAGKSILLGALGLIMGKRADTKSLFETEKKCVVEAYFNIEKYDIKSFFDVRELDYDKELVIRRELTPSGKSRAFINDTPVNLKDLQQLSSALIDLHQQFDTLDIHNVSFQLRMIDALANNQHLLNLYQQHFKKYQSDQRKLKALIQQSDNASREIDFLSFQLEEFIQVQLIEGEQEHLEEDLAQLTNAEDIKRNLSDAYMQLNEEENSLLNQLEKIAHTINSVQKFHPGLAKVYERFNGLLIELQDVAQSFEEIAESTEYDEERILEIQNRLDLIYKLQNKHRVNSVEELLAIQNDLQTRLTAFGDLSGEIEELETKINEQEQQLKKIAGELSQKRKKVVPAFEKQVHQLLGQLAMEHAQLKVSVKSIEELNSTGTDEVEFLFAPNKGSRFMSIKDVASGGELSRLTLCTKSLVASAIPLPTLIFDEIDTGISGEVALKMGKILADLAKRHQVISITHTPQIAVKADRHYFVYKMVKGNRTAALVKLLSPEERINEVATMLSGSPPTASAIENAKELLLQ